MVTWPVFRVVSVKPLSAGVDTFGDLLSFSAMIIFQFYGSLQASVWFTVRCQTKSVSILPSLTVFKTSISIKMTNLEALLK